MEFKMNSDTFKNMVERISVVTNTKAAFATAWMVKIEAKENQLILSAWDAENSGIITSDNVRIDEEGNAIVAIDDLKKLFSVKGWITVETEDGQALSVRNDKKKSTIRCNVCRWWEQGIPVAAEMENPVMVVDKQELVSTLANLSKFIGKGEVVKVLNCYNFSKGRVSTLDSHRIGIRKVDWIKDESLDLNVHGRIYKDIKKMAGKDDEIVNVFKDNRYATFSGKDWKYTAEICPEQYYNIDQLFPNNYECSFKVDSKEIQVIAKEYSKLNKGDLSPMIFNYNRGRMLTAWYRSDFQTMDSLEIFNECGLPENFTMGFNPTFLFEAVELFNGNVNIQAYQAQKIGTSPWIISGEDSDYITVILPVNIGRKQLTEAEQKFYDSLDAA